ncbi:hypothetical protein NDN01_16810 [Sphingomonas sp. QA11]|uniref:hypothetical protein n=1 Tax=Sphingomonas sp. QA11 TaxID=2950605 RepID=UPI002349301F|nr:hypothetical protein [Sphingomonas sp. QA11]WCM25693.1 hypothetical protein NDN01_16810 [Sphingomonas sp. QA11]
MLAHVPISIGIQLACWGIGRLFRAPTRASVWIGCFAGAAVCIMREITQREYQWIEQFGDGRRANMPGYVGLEIWDWNTHSISETVVAVLASVALAIVVARRA